MGGSPAAFAVITQGADMIRNLIWDVDGTLFDTYPAIVQAFLQALESLGQSAPMSQVDSLARVGLSHCARELAAQFGLVVDELADRFGELYTAIPKVLQVPFEGVKAVCKVIVAGGGINTIATHRGYESTEELLTTHAMCDFFTQIVAGDEGYPKKPNPAAFQAIIDKCGLDPRETAAIGDRDVDILAGKAAGLWTCLFRGDGLGVNPDFAFSDYRNLLHYLEGNQSRPTTP